MSEVKLESLVKKETKPRESLKEQRYHRGRDKKNRRQPASRTPKYTGNTEDLKGHVFDLGYNQSDQYTATIREISQYVGKNYKYGADVKISIDSLTELTLVMPTDPIYPDPGSPSSVIKILRERSVDAYVRRAEIPDQNLKTLHSLV